MQELKLIYGESKFPREVYMSEVLRRSIRYRDERHVCREFM